MNQAAFYVDEGRYRTCSGSGGFFTLWSLTLLKDMRGEVSERSQYMPRTFCMGRTRHAAD